MYGMRRLIHRRLARRRVRVARPALPQAAGARLRLLPAAPYRRHHLSLHQRSERRAHAAGPRHHVPAGRDCRGWRCSRPVLVGLHATMAGRPGGAGGGAGRRDPGDHARGCAPGSAACRSWWRPSTTACGRSSPASTRSSCTVWPPARPSGSGSSTGATSRPTWGLARTRGVLWPLLQFMYGLATLLLLLLGGGAVIRGTLTYRRAAAVRGDRRLADLPGPVPGMGELAHPAGD